MMLPMKWSGVTSARVEWISSNPVQRPQDSRQILLFGGREPQRVNFRIEIRIAIAAAVVILDDFFQSGEASVVHIRCGARDLAQGGRLEIASAGAGIGERTVAPGDA